MDNKKAYALMAVSGESWAPVAGFLTEDEAKDKAKMLNFRLFGHEGMYDHRYGDESGFRVLPIDWNPVLEDTTGKQYHGIDPDDPDWHPTIDIDLVSTDPPEDMYHTALMLERGELRGDYELREPVKETKT